MSGKFSSARFLPSFWHCTVLNMRMIPPAVCPSSKLLYPASVMSSKMDQAVSRTSTAPGTTDSPPRSRRPKTAFSIPATSCTSSTLSQTSPQSFSLRSGSGNERVYVEMVSFTVSFTPSQAQALTCSVPHRFVKRLASRLLSTLKCLQEKVSCSILGSVLNL